MNIINKNKLLQALSLILLIGIVCCCTDDREYYEVPAGGNGKNVTLSVRIPGAGAPRTYALTENDENEVGTIVILLFQDDKYTYQPVYCNDISTDPGDSRIKTFSVKVPEGTYDMVVFANAGKSLSDALGTINTGDSKSSVIGKVILSNPGKWNTHTSSGSYIAVPMWGEIANVSVSAAMPANTPVTLVRMIAKIDVALTTPEATSKFKLQNIRLYNYNNKGSVAPHSENWNNDGHVATAPSVPGSAAKPSDPVSSALVYTDMTTENISCMNEIYTFEAAAGSESTLSTNTCLVIGGIYGNDSQLTYYRIDIANSIGNAAATYLPLLRNHHYKINITNIKGAGLPTPEDAFKSRPVNIEANVINWNDGQISDIVFDGQYMMGVSQGEFTFSREARNGGSSDNTLSVTTDYPSGWKVQKIIDESGNISSWLSMTPNNDSSGATTKAKLIMSENTGSSQRSAFVHLTAGRLTYIVKIHQQTTSDLSITTTDINDNQISILEFITAKDVQPARQQFKLKWSPSSSVLNFAGSTINNMFTFSSGTDLDQIPSSGSLSDVSGTKMYTIQPPAITTSDLNSDPFYERSSIILYTTSDGLSTVNKTFILRQYVYNMIPAPDGFYLMDGAQKSFGVRSNTPFTVSIKSNPSNVISLVTTSGGTNTSAWGTRVYFNIANDMTNPSLYQKDAVVTIKSPTGKFPDTDVTLNCVSGLIQPESNSYIVAPNGVSILIPVSRANKSMLGNQLGSNESFTADLVWTDNSNRIAANSNIKTIRTAGTGTSGYILVSPGSAQGNAIVAVKNTSGKILWSWHIWVTSYTPTGKFMDRNLGAIGNTPGDVNTKGLLYQWGRKDAFPGSGSLTGTLEPTLYTATGTTAIAKTQVSVSNNLANSIANPSTFYYGAGTNNNDWYTNSTSTTQNNDLWKAAKTVYDPCPAGWRVAENSVWTDSGWSTFANYGRANSNYGGFYPAAGFRSNSTGNLQYAGSVGYYWSSSIYGVSSYYLYMTSAGIYPNYDAGRAGGFSVRCVKE